MKNLTNLRIKKVKIYSLFILNKNIIFILNYYYSYLTKKWIISSFMFFFIDK